MISHQVDELVYFGRSIGMTEESNVTRNIEYVGYKQRD